MGMFIMSYKVDERNYQSSITLQQYLEYVSDIGVKNTSSSFFIYLFL